MISERQIVLGQTRSQATFALLPQTSELAPLLQELAEAKKRGVHAQRFLARRAFVRATIARQCNVLAETVDIRIAPSGALVLATPHGLHLSLAGRDDFCAMVVSSLPIGIDIEPVVPAEPILTVLHQNEIQVVKRAPDPSSAFLVRWCAKEAWFKARATGFDREPSSLEIIMDDSEGQRFRVMDHASTSICGQGKVLNIALSGRAFIAAIVTLAG